MVLKLFNLLATFLGLDCTVLLTHLHSIPGITKVAIGNFCFCLSQAYPLSSLLLKELLRGSEMSSDLLSGTYIAGCMFTKPIFIRRNCSSQKCCMSAEYVCVYVCMYVQSRKQHLAKDLLSQAISVQQHFDAASIFFFTMHQTFIIGG